MSKQIPSLVKLADLSRVAKDSPADREANRIIDRYANTKKILAQLSDLICTQTSLDRETTKEISDILDNLS